jgi:hypothetical protein
MAEPTPKPVATADAEIGRTRYAVSIHTGAHTLTADETAHEGGADAGPSPFGARCLHGDHAPDVCRAQELAA